MIIGETGWLLESSLNNTDNYVTNLLAYYEAIEKWALENRVMTYMFEKLFLKLWES